MNVPICIFCLQANHNLQAFCKDNPGQGCTYGLGHEMNTIVSAKKVQATKIDKQLCLKCKLHLRNPASQNNGCQHEYLA